jgi:glyoxylase-like metal-dependent hydrolase (beta-lactamase superfamily II)
MGSLAGGGMAALARTGDYITDSVLPVFAAGQADLVGDEHAVASEISVELAPGHTPGQMMVRLGSGRDQAILSADLMHHPLQVRYPEWSTRFCTDPAASAHHPHQFFQRAGQHREAHLPGAFPEPDRRHHRARRQRLPLHLRWGNLTVPYNRSKILTFLAVYLDPDQ